MFNIKMKNKINCKKKTKKNKIFALTNENPREKY